MQNNPKEIRKKILECLYNLRHEEIIPLGSLQEDLKNANFIVDDKNLHNEIIYLEEKGYLEIKGKYMGKKYLYFSFLSITAYGVDLVEDPEEFNNLFNLKINNIGNISNSNVAINSSSTNQYINISELPNEIQLILSDLKKAIDEKDDKTLMKLLSELNDGAKSVFWNIVSSIIINI